MIEVAQALPLRDPEGRALKLQIGSGTEHARPKTTRRAFGFFNRPTKGTCMALIFEANYSKKLGLPGHSSHQYSITVRSELSDLSRLDSESARLYALMQASVDREIQKTGFLPGNHRNGNGHHRPANGNRHSSSDRWNCSDKQRGLIQRIVSEHRLAKHQVEQLAEDRFGKPVKGLNKLEASGLIEELIRQVNTKDNGRVQTVPVS
jgi:hypothetical protein